jgi:nucleotide-binding universal stress UspA family protein
MSEPRPILVGVDFSAESEIAVSHAVAVARRVGAEVMMVHVDRVIEPGDLPLGSRAYRELRDSHQARARELLAELRERHEGQGAVLSHSLVDGFADDKLPELAEELDCQLTVVGTQGNTGFRRLLLGSVAERVVRGTAGDVLVARPGRSAGGYRRILVPTDFSPCAERALERALEVAADDAEVDLFHVRQLPAPVIATYHPIGLDTIGEISEALRLQAEKNAGELLDRHRRDGVTTSFSSVEGHPVEAISDRAGGYDLIVMGSHGRRGLKRFVLGSVAEATVRHAPCSVLVVH